MFVAIGQLIRAIARTLACLTPLSVFAAIFAFAAVIEICCSIDALAVAIRSISRTFALALFTAFGCKTGLIAFAAMRGVGLQINTGVGADIRRTIGADQGANTFFADLHLGAGIIAFATVKVVSFEICACIKAKC